MSKTRRERNYDSVCHAYSLMARGVERVALTEAPFEWPEIFEFDNNARNVRLTEAAKRGDWFVPSGLLTWDEAIKRRTDYLEFHRYVKGQPIQKPPLLPPPFVPAKKAKLVTEPDDSRYPNGERRWFPGCTDRICTSCGKVYSAELPEDPEGECPKCKGVK